ncbi:MAG: S-methyl-5'-thioadenosine phosphorylase [Candidatus Margulisbacteria bacterium]|nr:S-methyl-5'-thioadenosine phosphorylase [Candidatus Margulisiibacteriota bacterium]
MEEAKIGIFGGSGFYKVGENIKEVKMHTPYGPCSSHIFLATIEGKRVAFIPRHGVKHEYPPHKINYRANLWAFKELGVKQIFGPGAAGSLQKHVKPGSFVICDQFVDRTWGRTDTYYEGPVVAHITSDQPYCPFLRKTVYEAAKKIGIDVHPKGTVVVINGPRFSSKAESKWFINQGWEVINMTQYPEAILARELEMCYVNISLITDYDCGLEQDENNTVVKDILKTFNDNLSNLQKLLFSVIKNIDPDRGCSCHNVIEAAKI